MSLARETGGAGGVSCDERWLWHFCRFAGVLMLSLGVGLG